MQVEISQPQLVTLLNCFWEKGLNFARLHPGNVFVDDSLSVVLGDYHVAFLEWPSEMLVAQNCPNEKPYVPPDVPGPPGSFDVFSLGVLIFRMVFGSLPAVPLGPFPRAVSSTHLCANEQITWPIYYANSLPHRAALNRRHSYSTPFSLSKPSQRPFPRYDTALNFQEENEEAGLDTPPSEKGDKKATQDRISKRRRRRGSAYEGVDVKQVLVG